MKTHFWRIWRRMCRLDLFPSMHFCRGAPFQQQSHPQALTPEGQKRTPWLTSWARATFEQGILSVLPLLEGPCTVTSLPGEHLFQASSLPTDRMRPAIFHAFGKAKIGAQQALRDLEKQGWETLPIAILGMPNLPPAWSVDDWKPVGGSKFSGYSSGIVGSSALRFCLLVRWRAINKQPSDLFRGPHWATASAVVRGPVEKRTWNQLTLRRPTAQQLE